MVKQSYSQSGEDVVVEMLANLIGIDNVFYCDIGAHLPKVNNNTYLFYRKGNRFGYCVDPHPNYAKLLREQRPRDIVLPLAVSDISGTSDFYISNTTALHSLDRTMIDASADRGVLVSEKTSVRTTTLTDLLDTITRSIDNMTPNFISIDAEGKDYDIMKAFDFNRFRPPIFCIETLKYPVPKRFDDVKDNRIINLMLDNGYSVFADTFINTIFVDQTAYENRKMK